MSQEKFIGLRHQMQQNQAELQDYLRDLDNWEEDIKQKDESLLKGGDHAQSTQLQQDLPPVRNSLEKKQKKKKKRPEKSEKDNKHDIPSKPKRISGYDYRSWDKYDVDKECEKVGDVRSASSSSELETDEEWEIERKKQQAVMLKEQGNQYFKEGRYEEAVECYTRGLACDSSNALLAANRAMALLKLESFAAAEADCSAAIALDPTYVKAYSRRATARVGLKLYSEASADFSKVLKLEPNNKQAKSELARIERIIHPPEIMKSLEVTSDQGVVKAITKPPHQRSKKPLRRIEIEEIGLPEDEERRAAILKTESTQSQLKKDITERECTHFDRLTSISETSVQQTQIEEITDSISGSHKQTVSRSETSLETVDLEGETPSRPAVSKLNLGSCDSEESRRKVPTKDSDVSSASPLTSPRTSPRVLPVPSTSYQFQADWKVLKNTSDEFYQYLKAIEPQCYAKLFGDYLDSDVLLKICRTLADHYIRAGDDVLSVLEQLVNVKRFSMTVMFLSAKEKQVLKDLFSHLTSEGKHDKTTLKKLAKKYEL